MSSNYPGFTVLSKERTRSSSINNGMGDEGYSYLLQGERVSNSEIKN